MDSLPPRPMWLILAIVFVFGIINTLAKKSSVAVSDVWLKQQSEEGNKKAKKLFDMLEKSSSKVMEAFDFASIFYIVGFSAISVYLLNNPICFLMDLLGIDNAYYVGMHLAALLITIILACIFYNVFVVMIPERIANKYADKIALSLIGYIKFSKALAMPILWICKALSRVFGFLFGVANDVVCEEVTEEEIRMLVDIGSESGAIDDDEKQMIHNIFEMGDKPVDEIMTHRMEACVLWMEDSIEDWKKFIDETNHTRYPVCGETIDDVIGIVNSRDFYRLLLSNEKDVKSILRDVFFIPDTIKADELFSKMQDENEHMGVVIDEYGGFQGIVTQEDLIEEIVGELYSEYDEPEMEENDIIQIAEDTWEIDGSAEIEDVENMLDIEIEEGDFNTFAGLVLSYLKEIPADGDVFDISIDNMEIKVTSVVEHRIEKTIVKVLPVEEDEDDEK